MGQEMKANVKRRKGPLEGVRIIDLTRATGGPYGSLLLADLGSEVIKIETPETAFGVTTRQKTSPEYSIKGDDLHFLSYNRNKKSIVLDLNKSKGKEVFYDLTRVSDVVYDNFRPGVLQRLGIDYETLRNINPKIISCSLTGFGSTGPWARKPAFDIIIQASSSLISFNASTEPDGRPAPLKLTVADLSGGMAAAYAIAAALYAREQTGEGQRIDIGMQDVIVSQLGYWASYLLNFGVKIDPWSSNIYGVFKAKDKYFIMCAHREGFWQNLCKTLNHEEWLTDPRFDSLSKRIQNREELRAIIEEILSTKEAAEWLEILTKGDVPCAPLNTLEEMLSEPQIIHRNMMIDVDHPLGGQVKLIGNPIKLSGTPEEVFEPPPLLGQHTVELLSELLGYPQEKIEALRDEKVID